MHEIVMMMLLLMVGIVVVLIMGVVATEGQGVMVRVRGHRRGQRRLCEVVEIEVRFLGSNLT